MAAKRPPIELRTQNFDRMRGMPHRLDWNQNLKYAGPVFEKIKFEVWNPAKTTIFKLKMAAKWPPIELRTQNFDRTRGMPHQLDWNQNLKNAGPVFEKMNFEG